jgi:Putative adhesin
MTNPEQPEQQPEVSEVAEPVSAVQATPELQPTPEMKEPEPVKESFGAHVERLVAEGKLTAAEGADLLEPVHDEPVQAAPAVQLAKAVYSGGSVPPDLQLEVEGYSLQVVHDPSLSAPRLTSSKDGVLELRGGASGWSIERTEYGMTWGLKAVLGLPFVARDVEAEVSGGNLTLSSISGHARLEVSGGNITVAETGSLRAEVSGGNLSAGAVTGSLELEVNGGNLSVAHSASLRAEINGGQLSWAGRLDSGRHTVEVNGGQATLRLDGGSSVTVEAESTLGGVSASFPLRKTGGMMHSTYSGVLGGGEAKLNCEVNAGQIRLVTS